MPKKAKPKKDKESSHPSSLFWRAYNALENERDGLTFDKLVMASGLAREQLTRILPMLQSAGVVVDRRTKRWIRLS